MKHQFFQTGWVVNDIDQAMDNWIEAVDVGPFFIRRNLTVQTILYRGIKAPLTVSVAIAQSGSMQIELIQQHNDGPSAYRDTFSPGLGGFHHFGAITDSYEDDVEHYRSAGVELAIEGVAGTARFAYFDTRSSLGFMTEVVERASSADLRAFFDEVAAAAVDWDGRDPVREVGGL